MIEERNLFFFLKNIESNNLINFNQSNEYIKDLRDLFDVEDELEAKIEKYDEKYSKWALTLRY